MPVFGISIQKIDDRLDPWVNTYYTVASNIIAAQDLATYLATGEAMIHSDLVTIINRHCWQVGTPGNFSNDAMDLSGALGSVNALPPWFTAELTLDSSYSYPGWKRYRTRIERSAYEGPTWSSAYLTTLDDFADYLDEVPNPLTTRAGASFTGASVNAFPMPLQLSKAWYNRT